jgi:putative FmdB family regulatory protein
MAKGIGDLVPTYEFLCEGCEPFEKQRSFVEASDPLACPSCGLAAKRVYHMPATRKMSTALSNAMDRAEKSGHEPEVVQRPAAGGASSGKKHQHSHGRPWALGH